MKFIDVAKLEVPEDWADRAREALRKASSILEDSARKKYIKNRGDIWRDLAEPLKKLSHGICWYCEAGEELGTQPVDHFRPRGDLPPKFVPRLM